MSNFGVALLLASALNNPVAPESEIQTYPLSESPIIQIAPLPQVQKKVGERVFAIYGTPQMRECDRLKGMESEELAKLSAREIVNRSLIMGSMDCNPEKYNNQDTANIMPVSYDLQEVTRWNCNNLGEKPQSGADIAARKGVELRCTFEAMMNASEIMERNAKIVAASKARNKKLPPWGF